MSKTNRRILIVGSVLLVAVVGFVWLRSFIFEKLDLSIQKRLTTLKVSGFNIRYDSLWVDWWENVIRIEKLTLERDAYDTTCVYPEFISVGRIRAEGIGLMQLVFQNTLSLESIFLDETRIVLRKNSVLELDTASQKDNDFTLLAEHVHIHDADFLYTDSSECRMLTHITTDISIAGLEMDFRADEPFRYGADILTMDATEIKTADDFYSFTIERARMNFDDRSFTADSIQIIPGLSKVAFGRKKGFEVDRFDGIIRYLKANDFSFSFTDTAFVKTSGAEIQFYLKVFRDKRLRFVPRKKVLPIEQLRGIPFALLIDSLRVTKSFVQYEEIAEESDEPGRVFFDNLYATVTNINNTSRDGAMQLNAQSNILGDGKLKLSASFPMQANKASRLSGSIEDFSLPEINPMLVPSTRIKIESGNMERLSFKFTYNEVRSNGEVELNYKDLKLTTFKDEEKTKGGGLEKDNLKSFIMNTFIIRKNMDEDVPEDKRTGAIAYVRDDSKSVFNFWVKSLLSGIKSAYNLDKVEAKKSDREVKKEERLSRREARKQRRAEKKKARG